MSSYSIFRQNLNILITNCLQKAESVSHVKHPCLIGELREIFISEVLLSILPEGFRIGTGKIADVKGNLSSQIDIIVYDRYRFSPVLFDDKKGIFPLESVYYAIEVKSKVTKKEIKDSIQKAEKLKSLIGLHPYFVLFGFSSNTKYKKSEFKRMLDLQKNYKNPPLNIFCVVGRGYGYYYKSDWKLFGNTDDFNEFVGLVIGIVNTLVQNRFRHINIKPGEYLGE